MPEKRRGRGSSVPPTRSGQRQRKHSPRVRRVICGSGLAVVYGEIACAGGCQRVPSMRSYSTVMALRPCLRAVSM